MRSEDKKIAIVDYGLGNLYSILRALEHVGANAEIVSSRDRMGSAAALMLPGVGAFGDAMRAINDLGLAPVIRSAAESGKPILGVCLGMQLLMTESFEFGRHPGLDIVKGDVVRFEKPLDNGRTLKVPQVGWNRIEPSAPGAWDGGVLSGIPRGEFMYFVHSYYVRPQEPALATTVTHYGGIPFCSGLRYKNVFAFQFHPERSGEAGLRLYKNFARFVSSGSVKV